MGSWRKRRACVISGLASLFAFYHKLFLCWPGSTEGLSNPISACSRWGGLVHLSSLPHKGCAMSERCWVLGTLLWAVSEWGFHFIGTGCFWGTPCNGNVHFRRSYTYTEKSLSGYQSKRVLFICLLELLVVLFFLVVWTKWPAVGIGMTSSSSVLGLDLFLIVFHYLELGVNSVVVIKKSL